MHREKKNFIITVVIASAVALTAIISILIIVTRPEIDTQNETENTENLLTDDDQIEENIEPPVEAKPTWKFTEKGWIANEEIPSCTESFKPPVVLNSVTSILYPGQIRGTYKPHGGFRFDNSSDNSIVVRAPLEGVVVSGAKYLEQGEVQYLFDFITPCGLMYRFDHLAVLSLKFEEIAESFSLGDEGDTRTTLVNPQVEVRVQEIIATSVGLENSKNVFVDFGLYDLINKNKVSKNEEWAQEHPSNFEQRALCWLDFFSTEESNMLKSLPAGDPISGKSSDYCE